MRPTLLPRSPKTLAAPCAYDRCYDACDDDLDLTLDFSGAGVGSASLRLEADRKVVSVGLLDDLARALRACESGGAGAAARGQKRTARAFQPSKKRRA